MRSKWPVLFFLGLPLAAALGYTAAPRGGAPASCPEIAHHLGRHTAQLDALLQRGGAGAPPWRETAGAGAIDAPWLRAEISKILREELPGQPGPGAKVPPPEPEPPSAESVAASETAVRVVDAAVTRKQWGDAQAEELRTLLDQMTEEQRARVVQQLVVAINKGAMAVTTSGQLL